MFRGPIEEGRWVDTVAARVVSPGARPHLHGYDVEDDLARHYATSDVTALALTGELPDDAASRAIAVAMTFLAATSVAEPPAHSAALARMYGAHPSAVTGVAAIALAEQARTIVAAHASALEFAAQKRDALEASHRAASEEERASVARLAELANLPRFERVRAADPSRTTALLCLLHLAGVTEAPQLEAMIVVARLPAAIAEGLATKPGSFEAYPMNTPPFVYAADDDEGAR